MLIQVSIFCDCHPPWSLYLENDCAEVCHHKVFMFIKHDKSNYKI